jgi:hypothetical protein
MNRADFVDWKNHPVTKAVFKQIEANVKGIKDELSISAGIDVRADGIRVGSIQTYLDILSADFVEDSQ